MLPPDSRSESTPWAVLAQTLVTAHRRAKARGDEAAAVCHLREAQACADAAVAAIRWGRGGAA